MSKSADPSASDNFVHLRGRLAADPVYRELPSGDVLAVFRITVARPPGERARVDSIECATVKLRAHKTLARAEPGDDVELTGCLHRRFWRTPGGPASRYAVDVETMRVTRAGRRGGASRVPKQASA